MSDRQPPQWPPPGLERIQGDLFGVASRAALAGGFLILPLLLVVTREQAFATLGPFADAWWITIALGTIGLAFGLDALARSARTLHRAGRAVERGYDIATVLRVLADVKRDMGFLLAGVRHFSLLEPDARQEIVRIRVMSGGLLALAGLWPIVALSFGLFFASRSALTPTGLQLVTLAPSVLAYMVGGVAYLIEERRVRKARRIWYRQPRTDDLVGEEVGDWRASVSAFGGAIAPGEPSASGNAHGGMLSGAAIVVGALSVTVALPVLILVPTSAVGPILTTVSAPGFESYRARAARAEAYRSYAAGADVSITAEEAGRILHDLTFVGSDRDVGPAERPPSRRVEQPWIPSAGEGDNPLELAPYAWGDSLLERVELGVTSEQRAYLAELASHPLFEDFSRLARASVLDAGHARWRTPFPSGVTIATLPVPRFGSLRSAADAHIGAAAFAVVDGRPDDAERLLSEVIAVGFLLGDDGPTLIDNLVGYGVVEAGGAALEDLFRVSGRPGAAAELSRLKVVAERAASMMRVEVARGTDAWVRSLPSMVLDPTIVRGLRWEYFINLATMAPCLNMHRMVFGADEAYASFVEEARDSLVRWPSDEALFELARYGWVGAGDSGPPGIFGRLAGLYMSTGENSCARMIRHIQAAAAF